MKFTNKIYHTKDYTYSLLKSLINTGDIVTLSGRKDSCAVIFDKIDYASLKRFQDFLRT